MLKPYVALPFLCCMKYATEERQCTFKNAFFNQVRDFLLVPCSIKNHDMSIFSHTSIWSNRLPSSPKYLCHLPSDASQMLAHFFAHIHYCALIVITCERAFSRKRKLFFCTALVLMETRHFRQARDHFLPSLAHFLPNPHGVQC